MSRSRSLMIVLGGTLASILLLSFQAAPRTATLSEVLKGLVGRNCLQVSGDSGVTFITFGPPGKDPVAREGTVFSKLDMVGEDFVRVSYKTTEYWIPMSRVVLKTTRK